MIERRQAFLRPRRDLGQCFLTNRRIAEIAAEHAAGKRVLELGPGYGILTRELCSKARSVVAVEIDRHLFSALSHEGIANLRMVNKDFFKASNAELGLDDTDIMVSNIPYELSSRVVEFLIEHRLEAVLYLQKEFVERMLAEPGTRDYSRLSVMSRLCFSITKIMDVGRGNFEPAPKVDSALVYMKPRARTISKAEREMMGVLMQHKKKTVRNAMRDSLRLFGDRSDEVRALADEIAERDERVFRLGAEELLAIARRLAPYCERYGS